MGQKVTGLNTRWPQGKYLYDISTVPTFKKYVKI